MNDKTNEPTLPDIQTSGIVNIKGKWYKTVALRIHEFRAEHPTWPIKTKIVERTENGVIVKATVKDDNGTVLATGLAGETYAASLINKTSAIENAETSAVGRALSFLGYGGTEIASAEEMNDALEQQDKIELQERYIKLCHAIVDLAPSILVIRKGLDRWADFADDSALYQAAEAYWELNQDEQRVLTVAPTKGGPLTTDHIKVIRSSEFRACYYDNRQEQENATTES